RPECAGCRRGNRYVVVPEDLRDVIRIVWDGEQLKRSFEKNVSRATADLCRDDVLADLRRVGIVRVQLDIEGEVRCLFSKSWISLRHSKSVGLDVDRRIPVKIPSTRIDC